MTWIWRDFPVENTLNWLCCFFVENYILSSVIQTVTTRLTSTLLCFFGILVWASCWCFHFTFTFTVDQVTSCHQSHETQLTAAYFSGDRIAVSCFFFYTCFGNRSHTSFPWTCEFDQACTWFRFHCSMFRFGMCSSGLANVLLGHSFMVTAPV